MDHDGGATYSDEVAVTVEMTEAYRLGAPYPNPFNPQTTFTLAVRQAQHVRVDVYDALGRRVAGLHDGVLDAGQAHRFTFAADGLNSGLYFIRILGDAFTETHTAMLLK